MEFILFSPAEAMQERNREQLKRLLVELKGRPFWTGSHSTTGPYEGTPLVWL
jgi:hypothetical protein